MILLRWAARLAVVLSVAGCGDGSPSAAPPPGAPSDAGIGRMSFTDVTPASGLTLRNVNGDVTAKPTILESLGQGAAAFDFDGDGLLDLFVCNGDTFHDQPAGATPRCALYRQDRPWHFTDVSESAHVELRGWYQGAWAADYDGDGRTDLFLTAFGTSKLLRNKGDGTFEDVTDRTGTGLKGWSSGAAFFDADGDGDLDLYVGRYVDFDLEHLPNGGKPCSYLGIKVACGPHGLTPSSDVFLENVGGRFVDASARFGFDKVKPAYALGVVAFDFDLDGDMDVYVANDSVANYLFENRGGGHFADVAPSLGCDLGEGGRPQASMGIDCADYDLDGRPDIFITNFAKDTSTLYRNVNDGKVAGFFDSTVVSGLGPPSFNMLKWGTRILDFDRDGWPDIVVANGHIYPQVDAAPLDMTFRQRNQMFRSQGRNGRGQVTFVDEKPAGGFFDKVLSSRGLLAADFDDDGDQDLFIVEMDEPPSLGRNDTSSTGHWLGVRLMGAGMNRDAIGAVLVIEDSGGRMRRVERTYGAGFYSTSDARLWTGLGPYTIKTAKVIWPDRTETPIPPTAIDGYVTADQATGTARAGKRP